MGESSDGEDVDTRTFPLHSVPDVLEPLLNEMCKAAEQMLTRPLRVLRGERALTSPRFPLEKLVSFEVTLRNVGIQAIETENPFDPHAPDRTNLRLLVSKDKPPGSSGKGTPCGWSWEWRTCTRQKARSLPRAGASR
ncbi:hypothetical protein ACN469_17065 [Corallococcus terminator]